MASAGADVLPLRLLSLLSLSLSLSSYSLHPPFALSIPPSDPPPFAILFPLNPFA
jgi:hypothetical protein